MRVGEGRKRCGQVLGDPKIAEEGDSQEEPRSWWGKGGPRLWRRCPSYHELNWRSTPWRAGLRKARREEPSYLVVDVWRALGRAILHNVHRVPVVTTHLLIMGAEGGICSPTTPQGYP